MTNGTSPGNSNNFSTKKPKLHLMTFMNSMYSYDVTILPPTKFHKTNSKLDDYSNITVTAIPNCNILLITVTKCIHV